MPLNSSNKGNPPLNEDCKKALADDLEKARDKLKGDKSAAKEAVKSLRAGLSKSGKTAAKDDEAGRGRGRGRGKGRGRGRASASKAKKDSDDELSEASAISSETKKLHGEVANIQDVEDLGEGEGNESELGSNEEAEMGEDSLSDAPTEIMGYPTRRPKAAASKPKAKKPGKTAAEKAKAAAAAKKKATRKAAHKARIEKINAKAAATSAALKEKYEKKGKTKKTRKQEDKQDKDPAEDKKASLNPWGANLREEMHKYVKKESQRLVDEGMEKRAARTAALKSCFGCDWGSACFSKFQMFC